MTSFAFEKSADDHRLDVVISGDLDMSATFQLESELDRQIAEGGVRRLDIDLADVGFIDSAGLGSLLSTRRRAEDLGIAMTVSRPSDPVRKLLELTGSDTLFS